MTKTDKFLETCLKFFEEVLFDRREEWFNPKTDGGITYENALEINAFRKLITDEFTDIFVKAVEEVALERNFPDWMTKYTTNELVERVSKSMVLIDSKSDLESFLDTWSLIADRLRNFKFDQEREPLSFEELDKFLFPTKKKSKKEFAEIKFSIDKWDELGIELYDDEFGRINDDYFNFVKFYNNKISDESRTRYKYVWLGWGEKVIEFLGILHQSERTGSVIYTNRKVKSRVDLTLRKLFNMGDEMSIISPKDRGFKINIDSKGKYYPLIKVIRYDRIGNMYSNKHYFANTGNESRDDVTQSEDALDYVDDI